MSKFSFQEMNKKVHFWITYLVSKLVTREAQDHQPMGVLALQLIQLAEVPGGGASEGGHILYQDHSSPEDIEVYRVPF